MKLCLNISFFVDHFFSDINECLKPNVCGSNAVCLNQVGNHTCQCLEGFEGNPYDGVSIIHFFEEGNAKNRLAHPFPNGSLINYVKQL